jgi:hypothetical protein
MRLLASKDVTVLFDQDNELAQMRMKVFDTACCDKSTILSEGNPQKLLFRSERQWQAHYSSKTGSTPCNLPTLAPMRNGCLRTASRVIHAQNGGDI